jgi:hypothetical protein
LLDVLQAKGAQMTRGPVRQAPAPSQTSIPEIDAPLQVPAPQTVPVG